ncbi:hypothetical protein [uncultured Treponema sp.]|uniref:hypothetical protein n=1 Tax=uncultured Treponema sp. TaxID=162155 RepID=UPI0025F5B37F|nr:hypothetical protein [uncultured Treponema sp.]
MKKKIRFFLFTCLFALFLTSCDEVLSVVTVGDDGKKIVNNYVSMIGDTVYDESVSLKSWEELELLKEENIDLDDLLFKIVNKKDKIIVLGDEEAAIEITFFEGGYKFKLFGSMDSLNEAFKDL